MGLLDERFDSSIDGPLLVVTAWCRSDADLAAAEATLDSVLGSHKESAPVVVVRNERPAVAGLWRRHSRRLPLIGATAGGLLGATLGLSIGPGAGLLNALLGLGLGYGLMSAALRRQLAAPLLLPTLRSAATSLPPGSALIVACIERELASLAQSQLRVTLGHANVHTLAVREQHRLTGLV